VRSRSAEGACSSGKEADNHHDSERDEEDLGDEQAKSAEQQNEEKQE
jgi:hypothetical protein